MSRRWIELLVPPRPAQVCLEDLEPVIVLLLRGVRFPKPPLEDREMMVIGGQKILLLAALNVAELRHYLSDDDIVIGSAGVKLR